MNTFVQNLIALASAALGALLASSLHISHRALCALISFAAGTLFAATFFHIIPEASGLVPWGGISLALFSGYLLFSLVSRYVYHVCPACSASHMEEHAGETFNQTALLFAIALGLHSSLDGLAIAVGHDVSSKMDLSLFLTITIHKFPEGLALCALLLDSNYTKKKALFITIVLESLTLAGWMLGNFLLHQTENLIWLHLALLHVGGGFIYLAVHATLGEAKKHSPLIVVSWFLAGVVLIGATRWLPL